MSKAEWAVVVSIVVILAALIVPAIDRATGDRVLIGSGTIIHKSYTAATHSSGTGFSSNGKDIVPVVVNSSTPEEWVVIVKYGSETFSDSVDASTWGAVDNGSEVDVLEIRGKIATWGKTVKPRALIAEKE